MAVFIARRLVISVLVLLIATFLMYNLVALSGDPLNDLYGITNAADKERRIQARIAVMHLDQSPPERWAHWLTGVLGYVVGHGTLGSNRLGQSATTLLALALSSTLKLVIGATVLAIITGVTVGIISALRQYSAFDYSITFASFLFFSLPIFWVALLLKQYGAIKLNNWLQNPVIPTSWIIGLSIVSGLFWAALVGGREWRRRLIVFAVALVVSGAILYSLSSVLWFKAPALGPGVILVGSLGAAVAMTELISGIGRRRVLYATLATAIGGTISWFATNPVLTNPNWPIILGLLVLGLAIGAAFGFFIGGEVDRRQAIRASVFTAFVSGLLIFLDHLLRAFSQYVPMVGGTAISTIGSNTPNFDGNYWQTFMDTVTHLVLPTIALILISFATYTRFTRASMLETMNQDFVRTARSKGLTERAVVMRHAFRNALIPVTTLMAFDFAAVLGGAVITERVFGWQGMGNLFITGLNTVDPPPVMAFFLVVGTAVVLFNLIADLVYAILDPRIRLS